MCKKNIIILFGGFGYCVVISQKSFRHCTEKSKYRIISNPFFGSLVAQFFQQKRILVLYLSTNNEGENINAKMFYLTENIDMEQCNALVDG